MPPDPGAHPSNRTDARPVRRRRQWRPGCHPLGNQQIVVLERLLVTFGALAQIDQLNAEGCGLLGHPQMLDQSRGLPAETRVIRREPLREHVA